ncbi:Clp protease N-terminal domain-containing protein [Dactylosporangium sp. NPDC048998]|uniref:Clp protease N-terminal domain-containing protein n=1 Tax=Dactylosporangium sp. NPDC048998 TaxID=3363976 RepID=UPI00370FC656
MQVTDQALRATVLASEAAHTLGAEQVGSYHLLLGLADAEGGARHALGLSSERLREVGATLFPPKPEHQGDARVPFAAELKEALERGIRQARASGHDHATTVDLLFALLGQEAGQEAGPEASPAAELLRAAGTDPAEVRAALAEQDHGACCQETGVSPARPILADMGSRADLMPGRLRTIAGVVGNLIPCALLYAAVLAVSWDTSGPELVLTVGTVATLIPLMLSPLGSRRQIRRLTALAPTTVLAPEDIQPMLNRLGLRQLEIRIRPGIAQDRCYRLGRRAWIVLSGHTEHQPEPLRFVLWHEIAHLARRDGMRRGLVGVLSYGLILAALVSFDPRAMAIAFVGVPVVAVAGLWWSEAACDRLAARHAGTGALHAWAADRRAIVANLRPSRRARAKGWFAHPPLALRTALHPQAGQDGR